MYKGKKKDDNRDRYSYSCIFVNFKHDISDVDIKEFIDSKKLKSIRVSTLLKRFAIDVPVGMELYWCNFFQNSYFVDSVVRNWINGYDPKRRGKSDFKQSPRH